MAEYTSDRYEFRVFAHDLTKGLDAFTAAAQRINKAGEALVDQYFLCSGIRGVNLKVRRNRLSIKVLQDQQGALERWHPVSEQAFPIDARALKHIIRGCFGITLDVPNPSPVDAQAFVNVIEAAPALSIARVSKHRSRFDFGDNVMGEYAVVGVDGFGEIKTLAVEGPDRGMLEDFIQSHDLSAFANESYPAYLRKIFFG